MRFSADIALVERDRWRPLVSTSKTLEMFSRRSSGAFWRLILFYWAFKVKTCTAVACSSLR